MNVVSYNSTRDRTWLPVGVAVLLSIFFHVALLGDGLTSLRLLTRQQVKERISEQVEEQSESVEEVSEDPETKQDQEDHILLGRDHADEILTMNWIGYEAFEKLIAMPAKTQQAAFQRLADPIEMPDADPQIDPASNVMVLEKTIPRLDASAARSTPQQQQPQQTVQKDVQAKKPVDSPVKEKLPESMEQASPVVKPVQVAKVILVPVMTPQMDLPDRIAHEQPVMSKNPAKAKIRLSDKPAPVVAAAFPEAPPLPRVEPSPEVQKQQDAAKPTPSQPQQQQQRESVAQPLKADQIAEKIRPTNVPRQDRESAPYSMDHHQITGKIGSVIVGKGIEIQTRIPRFTAVTQASIWPKANPVLEITFAADGVVITAQMLRSSGYAGIDSPILASVYHWKAKGKLLEKLNQKFKRKFTFNLIDDEIE